MRVGIGAVAATAAIIVTGPTAQAEVISGPNPDPLMGAGVHIASSRAPGFTTLWSITSRRGGDVLTAYRPAEGSTMYTPPPAESIYALFDIAMTAHNDGWIVGQDSAPNGDGVPYIARFNGRRWTRVQPAVFDGLKMQLSSVVASAPDDVWVTGYQVDSSKGSLYHFDGTHWTRASAEGESVAQVLPVGHGDVWASFARKDGLQDQRLRHWDGTRWETHSPAAQGDVVFDMIGATSPTSVYAMLREQGELGESYVVRWDGDSWQRSTGGPTAAEAADAALGGAAWVVAARTVAAKTTWHGWETIDVPNVCTNGRFAYWQDAEVGRTDAYLTGACIKANEEYLLTLHYENGRWTRV